MEADKNTHQYKPDASFENAVALYEFDAELREMVFRAIDREIHWSKEDFIKQHYKKYTKPAYPPAWKTLELLSLGTLTKIFTNSSVYGIEIIL